MSRLLTSNGNLSLPYRMSSINNSFERLEMSQGGKIALRPLRIIIIIINSLFKVG